MKKTPKRIPSPARSQVFLRSNSKRHYSDRSQSADPDPRSTPPGRNSKTRFSNDRRRISGFDFVATSYLQDDTAVNSVRKEGSWWKALGDNSPFANEILQPIDNDLEGIQLDNINEGEASTRGGINLEGRYSNLEASQISGDSTSPHSINVQRKTLFGGRNKPRKTIPNVLGNVKTTGDVNNQRRSESSQFSGDSISPHSINVQRKTLFGGKNKERKSLPNAPEDHTLVTNTKPSSDETPSDIEITTQTHRKRLFFMKKPKADKPNIEIPLTITADENNETAVNQTHNLAKTKKTFFQHPKNMQPRGYEKFILESSNSDDSLDQADSATNANAHALQNRPPRALLASRRKISIGKAFQIGSPRLSNASETLEFDNWKLLPSSTMIESAEQNEISPDSSRKTIQTTSKRVSITNSNPIAIDNESDVATGLQTRRSTRLSIRSKRMSSPMKEKENLNLENSAPVTVSRKLFNVLDGSPENISRRTRSVAITENYSLNITNNRSNPELQQEESSPRRSLRTNKSKDASKDLQSDNIHKTRNHSRNSSRNGMVSSLISPQAHEISKRKSKLLGPKSVREKRMKSNSESYEHSVKEHSEREIIIPETLEMETQRSSNSPVRKSRSNQMRETLRSGTQYANKSVQSNDNILLSNEISSERVEGISLARDIETNQDDDEQNNQTSNEEVALNDGEKLNFSFSHGSGNSNATNRQSTMSSDVSRPSKRISLNKSNRNLSKSVDNSNKNVENNRIDENDQQDQNVINRESIVSISNDHYMSAEFVNNKVSAINKSLKRNSNKHEQVVSQHEQINSVIQSTSSKGSGSRVSVGVTSNQHSGISPNKSNTSNSVHENSNRTLKLTSSQQNSNRISVGESLIQQDEQSISRRQSIVSRRDVSRVSVSAELTNNLSSIGERTGKKMSTHQNSNRTEVEESHIQQDEQSLTGRHSIVSRGHASHASTSAQLNMNRITSNETLGKKSTEKRSVSLNSNRSEIEVSGIQQDEQNVTERQNIVSRSRRSQTSSSALLTNPTKEKSVVNKPVHESSKINETEHVHTTRLDVTLTNTDVNKHITNQRINLNNMQEIGQSPALSKTPKTATNTNKLKEKTTQSIFLRESRLSAVENNISLHNNRPAGDMNVPSLRYTGQKDLTRKSLNKSKHGPNATKLGSSQSKRTDVVERTQLEKYLDKIKEQNLLKKKQAEEAAINSLKPTSSNTTQRNNLSMFKSLSVKQSVAKTKPKANSTKAVSHTLVDGKVYKAPKVYFPNIWVTARLYKYLEKKLEPKYKLKTRVRSEKLVRILHGASIKIKRNKNVDPAIVAHLKREMARIDIVQTHFEFYNFVENYLPMELRTKIIPNLVNRLPLPENIHAKIL